MTITKRKRGKILEAVRKTANGLHAAGVMKQAAKREFDALCLTSTEPMKSAETRAPSCERRKARRRSVAETS